MTVVLFLHSWLRWLVLAALVGRVGLAGARLAQGAPFEKVDRATSGALLGVVHTQMLVGLVMMALSPSVHAAMADMGAAMHDPTLRFYTVEHGPTMLVAGLVQTLVVVFARRAADDRRRHLITAVGTSLVLLVILAMIPWPFRQVARPWVMLP